MKIVAVMPIYGRPMVTGYSIHTAQRIKGLDNLIVVGSTPEDEATAGREGAEYHHADNDPLGSKWQRCFELALDRDADAVLFLGSDDWWRSDIVMQLSRHLKNHVLVAPYEWGLLDLETDKAYMQTYSERHDGAGTGRLYDAHFIREKLGGVLYEPDAPRAGMDGYATRRIEAAGGSVYVSPLAVVISLKGVSGDQQIYRTDDLIHAKSIITEECDPKRGYFDTVRREWKEWASNY